MKREVISIGPFSSVEMITEKNREKELDKEFGFKTDEGDVFDYVMIFVIVLVFVVSGLALWCIS